MLPCAIFQAVVHNAAATLGPLRLTVDNLERQIVSDHIGPFLLTKLIAPKILAAGTESYVPRVVYVSNDTTQGRTEVDGTWEKGEGRRETRTEIEEETKSRRGGGDGMTVLVETSGPAARAYPHTSFAPCVMSGSRDARRRPGSSGFLVPILPVRSCTLSSDRVVG
ncbi:hypothetical protein B0H17DRAFT_207896 [Mycena rosella]|uniref:Uncharacterized protein n=1 Tax=Mycena rosella TaxID=1033263 RepID=A0AAD7G8A8_MYCRO|nr:hypothetical protein B0H17DRAFT_207896 [Mycena rosella]